MKAITTLLIVVLTVTFSLTTQKLKAMEKKSVKEIPVLKYTMKTTIASLTQDVGETANELLAKANELGLEITGPQIWQYTGCDGQPNSKFTLDICVPVKELKGDGGKFKLATLAAFTCVSEIHKGPWNKLSNTYSRIMGELSRKSIPFTGVSREVYITCDFENQENCVTEVQMEIQ